MERPPKDQNCTSSGVPYIVDGVVALGIAGVALDVISGQTRSNTKALEVVGLGALVFVALSSSWYGLRASQQCEELQKTIEPTPVDTSPNVWR